MRIVLPAGPKADLRWSAETIQAATAVNLGEKIRWKIDLGLFDGLNTSIFDETQFAALSLSLNHFKETLWPTFGSHSLEVCLYEGSADLFESFSWGPREEQEYKEWLAEKPESGFQEEKWLKTLFLRDVAADFLKQLVQNMPDKMPLSISFTFPEGLSSVLQAVLASKECFGRFLKTTTSLPIALLLPPKEEVRREVFADLEETANLLTQQKKPFRLIAEKHLTAEWEGLDQLFVVPRALTKEGKRKVAGFQAAGGEVFYDTK